jgi:hypothetical protein
MARQTSFASANPASLAVGWSAPNGSRYRWKMDAISAGDKRAFELDPELVVVAVGLIITSVGSVVATAAADGRASAFISEICDPSVAARDI